MTGAAANLYAYGNNNPVMMSDPTGHISLLDRLWYIGQAIYNIGGALSCIWGFSIYNGWVYEAGQRIAMAVTQVVYELFLLKSTATIEAAEVAAQQWYAVIITTVIIVAIIVAYIYVFKPAYDSINATLYDLKKACS